MLDMSNPINQLNEKEAEAAAQSRGIGYRRFNVAKVDDIARAFESAEKQRLGALTAGIDGIMSANLETIVQLAAKHRLPVIYRERGIRRRGRLDVLRRRL